jgi:alcohol dehydrogenase class IV
VPPPHSFSTPSSILFGAGARSQLASELRRLNVTQALIVTDRYLQDSGVLTQFESELAREGISAAVFCDVQPDPTDENVAAGLRSLTECRAQALVAIGGGSVMDAAKMIGIAARNPQPLSDFQGYHKIAQPGLPLIAIPTTAGTGSEVSQAAVITDTSRQVKMMIFDRKLLPTISIVDYELSLSMPPHLTAHVGVDTLVHGIEAYVSRKASGMTDPLALSCIHLTSRHLPVVCTQPDHRQSREAMALAACQGGMAFSNSSVCLVHGMSRPLGAVFHLPHGLSNAVLLPAVTRFSIPGAPERYAAIAREMRCPDEEALVPWLEEFNLRLNIPRLRDCIGKNRTEFESHLAKMAADALASGSPQNNPVVPSADEIIGLYREAW